MAAGWIRDAPRAVYQNIMASKANHVTPGSRRTRDLLRDPAIWAWLLVALLAIVPAHAAIAHAVHGTAIAQRLR